MLTEPAESEANLWRALVRPGRKVAIGERLVFPAPTGEIVLEAEVLDAENSASVCCSSSQWTISSPSSTASATCPCRPTSAATMPTRIASATRPSSPANAAPWPRPPPACTSRRRCSDALAARGVEIARITLHVGLGTFAPLRVDDSTRSACTASATPFRPSRRRHQRCRAKAAASSPSAPPSSAPSSTARFRPPAAPIKPTPAKQRSSSPPASVPPRRRPAHQLPPAPIQPAHAGQRLRRPRAGARRLSPCRRGEIPLLQLRRLHVCPVIERC